MNARGIPPAVWQVLALPPDGGGGEGGGMYPHPVPTGVGGYPHPVPTRGILPSSPDDGGKMGVPPPPSARWGTSHPAWVPDVGGKNAYFAFHLFIELDQTFCFDWKNNVSLLQVFPCFWKPYTSTTFCEAFFVGRKLRLQSSPPSTDTFQAF